MKKRIYKLRYHLGNGPNKGKWQLTSNLKNTEPSYIDPDTSILTITNGILKNRSRIAQAIFCGANKSVCAWIESTYPIFVKEHDGIGSTFDKEDFEAYQVFYNPRKRPYWTDLGGNKLDGTMFQTLQASPHGIYALFSKRPMNSIGHNQLYLGN